MMTDMRPGRDWAMLALVVLVGLNLRPFLAAPAPILAEIVADTGLGYGGVAMLTLLPMFLMGVGAFVAPGLQVRTGTRHGLLAALAILLAGSALRLFAKDGLTLIATAALCGIGVAFIQAAFPGIIKARFPTSVPVVTGLYSAVIMAGGAFGARLMPVLVHAGFGWRAALAWLALPVALALAAAWRILSDVEAKKPDGTLTRRLLRRPRTWALMAAFGLINAGYSSMIAWLAPYYQAQGWTSADGSGLVAVMAACQAAEALGRPGPGGVMGALSAPRGARPAVPRPRQCRSPPLALADHRFPDRRLLRSRARSRTGAGGLGRSLRRGPWRQLRACHRHRARPSAATRTGRRARRADAGRRVPYRGHRSLCDGAAA
jgi:CP family cyanate transporter-like MFS transporter